jgi:Spy/CpxP family protein refolding chaperone
MHAKMVTCLCVLSLVMSASPAFCVPDSAMAARDSSRQKWWAQLNLTADQKAKLKTLRAEMKDFRKANFEKMKSLLDKNKAELLKAAPNRSVLFGYAKEMGDLHETMSEHMADHMLKMKSILTKEQFEKLLSRDMFRGPQGRGHHAPEGRRGGAPHDMDD